MNSFCRVVEATRKKRRSRLFYLQIIQQARRKEAFTRTAIKRRNISANRSPALMQCRVHLYSSTRPSPNFLKPYPKYESVHILTSRLYTNTHWCLTFVFWRRCVSVKTSTFTHFLLKSVLHKRYESMRWSSSWHSSTDDKSRRCHKHLRGPFPRDGENWR